MPPLALCCLVSVALGLSCTCAESRYAAFIMSEQWTGLAGQVITEGKSHELAELLWVVSPAGDPTKPLAPTGIEPEQRRDPPQIVPEPQPVKSSKPVCVIIRGEKIEFTAAPRTSTATDSDLNDRLLGYPIEATASDLKLEIDPGRNTEWKLVSATRQRTRKNHGRGGFQFEIREVLRFRLEAAHRPGWFLIVADGRLKLSNAADRPHFIEVDQTTFFDDLTDGR